MTTQPTKKRKEGSAPYNKMLKTPIPRDLDRRIVVTEEVRARIRDLSHFGLSEFTIASDLGISRTSVRNVLRPQEYEERKRQSRELKKDGRYKPTKEKKREIIKEYRHNKKQVLNYKKQKGGRPSNQKSQ